MSFDNEAIFTKENLDGYLKELAKAFRKRNGTSMPAEIILVGGAAILVNYGFRAMTTDIDAIIRAASSMKDAINEVGNRHDLPAGWLNTEFMQTGSFSPKLVEHSVYYRTFSNVLQIRTVSAEHLIAMKLRSGRQYKNDLSDVVDKSFDIRIKCIGVENLVANVDDIGQILLHDSGITKDFLHDSVGKSCYLIHFHNKFLLII